MPFTLGRDGLLGLIRKPKDTPPTVLELTIETDSTLVFTGKPNTYELITVPRTIPRVILRDIERNTQKVKFYDWAIGYIGYDFEKNFWYMYLSMNTAIFSTDGKRVATGFNGEENHMGTSYGFLGGERIRYERIGLGMFQDEPYCFYPEIRVRIQDRVTEPTRR